MNSLEVGVDKEESNNGNRQIGGKQGNEWRNVHND